jgi:TetR/AcrR family transcriptional regulator, regulator of autoinduction and epiphytic fitness
VSVKRPYSSARREALANETRRSILDAAHEQFVATGYAATTVQAIADRAGVAVQTVYAVFGTKREVLRQLIERTIAGDDDQLPMPERADARSISDEPDARRRAELDAAASRSIIERVAPIVRIATEAAASDPELAAMMEMVKAARRQEMTAATSILAGPDGLRLPREEAAATLYVLYSPQVADMLIGDYKWTAERYEKWLARMILVAVLE